MSSFERHAAERLLTQALDAGVDIPPDIAQLTGKLECANWPGRRWLELHPDDPDRPPCCEGSASAGPERCTCWQPIYDLEQAEPRRPNGPQDLQVRAGGPCGDCAYRKDSPERANQWSEEALLELAKTGSFWCHQDMRRPARWVHPDGRTVAGSPDDYQPPQLGGIPYRADGSPGLLCAGWSARAASARKRALATGRFSKTEHCESGAGD